MTRRIAKYLPTLIFIGLCFAAFSSKAQTAGNPTPLTNTVVFTNNLPNGTIYPSLPFKSPTISGIVGAEQFTNIYLMNIPGVITNYPVSTNIYSLTAVGTTNFSISAVPMTINYTISQQIGITPYPTTTNNIYEP